MTEFSKMSADILELPYGTGDGYGYGGGCILKIGGKAFYFGQNEGNEGIAKEIVRLWNDAHQPTNAVRAAKEQSE